MNTNKYQIFGSALLTAATAGLGALALSQTDFNQPNAAVFGGYYQETVELDFNDSFPLSEMSRELWNAVKFAVFNQTHEDVIRSKDGWLFTADEFRQPIQKVLFADELNGVASLLNAAGIKLLPIIVPDKARIYSDKLPHIRLESLQHRYDWIMSQLEQTGLEALDLRPILFDLRGTAEPYLRTDTHWSPAGSEKVAKLIASLTELALDSTSAFETEWTDPTPFRGDLMKFTETGVFSDWVGFSSEEVTIATTEQLDGSMSLLGEANIPVVLVGTSFSANPAFNFEGFVKQHLGADVLNVAQYGRGPIEPMRDYLVSHEFKDTPPQLIIWEIPERYIFSEGVFR